MRATRRAALSVMVGCLLCAAGRADADEAPISHAGRAEVAALASTSAIAPEARTSTFGVVRDDMRALFSKRTAGLLATGAAIAAVSTLVEEPNRAADMVHNSPFDGPADAGNTYGSVATLGAGALAMMAIGRIAHQPALSSLGSESARSLLYTGVIVSAIKVGVDRTRPNGEHYSFPSGHSAAAFAVAPILVQRLGPRAAIPAYGLALATGMGRIEEHKHYLSDVVFGAAIGLSVGLAVSHSTPGGPEFSVGPGGAAVTVHF